MTDNIQSYILAIDSATSILRVGLSLEDGKLVSLENNDRFRHAEFIFGLIDGVLSRSGVDKSKLKGIVLCTGPGSFTGLRVGMASAKGLASSLGIPLAGVSIYSAIAARLYRRIGRAAVLVPSRRNEYYYGLVDSRDFDNDRIRVITAGELAEHSTDIPLLFIDGEPDGINPQDFKLLDPAEFRVQLEDLIVCGAKKLLTAGGDDISDLEPLYIQTFRAKTKK